MHPTAPMFLAFLSAVALNAPAQEPETRPPGDVLAALLAEHEASDLGYTEAYAAFRPRFEAFIAEHHGTPAEARATLWLVQQTWWLRPDGTMETTSLPLANDLLERHPTSPDLHLLVEYQYVFAKSAKEPLFERLHAVSPHAEVKAAAQFGLARLEPARAEDGEPNEHYALLLGEYADVPWRATTFGAIADAYVNPLAPEDLAVGKKAPEIVGVDPNGEALRLSDFAGRVVMLDFWGDW